MTLMQLLLCDTKSNKIGLLQMQPANCSNFIAPVFFLFVVSTGFT